MTNETVHIGFLSVELFLPASGSLKSKRRIIKSLKDKIAHRYNVSVAEIGDHDKWQKAVLGICTIGNDKRYLNGSLQRIVNLIEDVGELELTNQEIQFV